MLARENPSNISGTSLYTSIVNLGLLALYKYTGVHWANKPTFSKKRVYREVPEILDGFFWNSDLCCPTNYREIM